MYVKTNDQLCTSKDFVHKFQMIKTKHVAIYHRYQKSFEVMLRKKFKNN